MNVFWLGSILLLVSAIAFVVVPVFIYKRRERLAVEKGSFTTSDDLNRKTNIAQFEERLEELKNEKHTGILTEQNFTQLVNELEKTLLIDVDSNKKENFSNKNRTYRFQYLVISLIVIFIASASFSIYSKLGSLDEVLYTQGLRFDDNDLSEAKLLAKKGDMHGLLEQLHSKLIKAPNNLEGWSLLARSALNTNEFSLAAEAYKQIIRILEDANEDSSAIYGLLAQSLYYQDEGVMTPRVQAAIDQAFSKDKNELNTISLLAINDFSQGAFASAISRWEKILTLAPNHPAKAAIEMGIARAQTALGVEPNVKSDKTTRAADASVAKIRVLVSLDPALLNTVDAEDSVFIFAKSTNPSGPPMPLAAARYKVKDLPVTLDLTDDNAVAPMAKLSQVSVANIVARVTKSGQAIAQKGDYQGRLDNVSVKDGKLHKILIDQML